MNAKGMQPTNTSIKGQRQFNFSLLQSPSQKSDPVNYVNMTPWSRRDFLLKPSPHSIICRCILYPVMTVLVMAAADIALPEAGPSRPRLRPLPYQLECSCPISLPSRRTSETTWPIIEWVMKISAYLFMY